MRAMVHKIMDQKISTRSRMRRRRTGNVWMRTGALALGVLAGGVLAGIGRAETPGGGLVLSLTATTDNVSNARDSIRIDVLRWSAEADRNQLFADWVKATAPKGTPSAAGKQAKA